MTDTVTPTTIDQPHRVAFDVMAGIEPMTFLPGTTTEQITTRLRSAFLAADVIRDGQQFAAAIDVAEGSVVVSVDGCVIEHGSITAIEPAPKLEPTLRERVAAELHRIADDLVRLDLPLKDTLCSTLSLGVLNSRAGLERWAEYLGSTIEVDPSNGIPVTCHRILLDGREYGPWLDVRAQAPAEPQESELERLRAEVAELRAAQGGA